MTECEKECFISITDVKEEESDGAQENLESGKEEAAIEAPTSPPSIKSAECSVDERINEIDQAIQREEQDLVDPLDLYRKLEIIKEIKSKTLYLQRVKSRIAQEVDSIEFESKSLLEFKTELELLVREEKAHLDELRQIQSDIQMMESTIKQSNEEKLRALESAKRLNSEYKPLKDHINHLRDSIGLDKTDDNDDQVLIDTFINKLAPISDKSKSGTGPQNRDHSKSNKSHSENNNSSGTSHRNRAPKSAEYGKQKDLANNKDETRSTPSKQEKQVEFPVQLALMAQSLRALSPSSLSQHQQHFQSQFNPFILNQVNLNNEKSNQIYQQQQQLQSLPPPFRQQPPPMKTCLSCNQQIHRNAPICPLCKAKSRSVNPKKPKKKTTEISSSH